MTPIERILSTCKSTRADDVPMPTDEEFRRIETELGFHFPASYREFDTAEPVVLFADHETGYTYSQAAPSFTDRLCSTLTFAGKHEFRQVLHSRHST